MKPRYGECLSVLLTLGEPNDAAGPRAHGRWHDYASMGLGANDESELIRLATDKRLGEAPGEECFGPVHARRALGQFRCQGAVRPLIDLLDPLARAEDDWGLEDIPYVLAALGAPALPELVRALPDQRRELWARTAVGRAMTLIGKADPSCRAQVIKALTNQLALSRFNDPGLNGLLVSYLIDLNAGEAAAAIRRAYSAGDVADDVCGTAEVALAELAAAAREPVAGLPRG